jgi:acyl dehydratase
MRRYMTALLIFSVFHLAFAAPVNIGETLEVRSNAADAPKGGIAAWEKRMDGD